MWEASYGTSRVDWFSKHAHVDWYVLADNWSKRKDKCWVPPPKEGFNTIPLIYPAFTMLVGVYLWETHPAYRIWVKTDKMNCNSASLTKQPHPQTNHWAYLFFFTSMWLKKFTSPPRHEKWQRAYPYVLAIFGTKLRILLSITYLLTWFLLSTDY